ncbi:MAG: hypothetical protein IPK19_27405 [Chloroflexi bacterium]|nr:hypothetical protein [Chloroflexota bacterium]
MRASLEPVCQEANPVTIHSDWDIEWLPDSTTLVTIGAWGIQAYRLTDKSVIPDSRIYLTGIISDLQIIDKDVLAISDWSGEVCLVGVPDWGGLRCQKLSDKAIKRMSLSENGKYLGISSEDEIYLAEVNTRARHVQIISRMESGETGDIAVMNAGVGFTGEGC